MTLPPHFCRDLKARWGNAHHRGRHLLPIVHQARINVIHGALSGDTEVASKVLPNCGCSWRGGNRNPSTLVPSVASKFRRFIAHSFLVDARPPAVARGRVMF